MGRLLSSLFLFAVCSISFSLSVEEMNHRFPDGKIDFLITPKSYAEYRGLKVPLESYSLSPIGRNLYSLEMRFYLPAEVKRKKLLSGVYLNITERDPMKLNLQTEMWYRGKRLIGFNTPRGLKLFDLQPKCYLKREGDKWVPTCGGGDVVFTSPKGVKVHLFLTFTGCEF